MPDVRKMSDEDLFDAVELCYSQLDPRKTAVAECPKASHEEAIAELGRRLGIMRKYCEASNSTIFDDEGIACFSHDYFPSREAFRQMEAEREG